MPESHDRMPDPDSSNIQLTENDREKNTTAFTHINMLDIASPKVVQRIESRLSNVYK